MKPWLVVLGGACLLAMGPGVDGATRGRKAMPRAPVVLNDDGGWCWFQDERALVVGNRLFVGTVATGWRDPSRKGDIDVVEYDLKTGRAARFPLHRNLECDDHASPAFMERADGRLLTMYSKHGPENRIYYRIALRPGDARAWGPERVFVPSPTSRITYSNLHRLGRLGAHGRVYDFFRGYDNSFKPSWAYSDDEGETWRSGGVLVDVAAEVKHRPYAKYVSDGRDTVHVLFTEGHPRDFDNSIYHVMVQGGVIRRSDGAEIRALAAGPVRPEDATRVFAGDPRNVGWIHDVAVDRGGRLRAVFSVQKDSAGLPAKQGGTDLRYHWARWDGKAWSEREIARAGTRLYAGEDDYAGGVCVHPDDPEVVFISTNVDPVAGTPLASGHYELFRGRTRDAGERWEWEPLTPGAEQDQLRPIVPKWRRGHTALLWLRGKYRTYTDYGLEAVCRVDF